MEHSKKDLIQDDSQRYAEISEAHSTHKIKEKSYINIGPKVLHFQKKKKTLYIL